MTDHTRSGRRRLGVALVLLGCVLFTISLFVPVMQWSVNAAHSTAGDARIWIGDAWTLADGGFEGASLLPVASAAVVLLAALAVLGRTRRTWQAQVALALVVGYVPAWTAVAFARKWEDQVDADTLVEQRLEDGSAAGGEHGHTHGGEPTAIGGRSLSVGRRSAPGGHATRWA